MKSLIHIYEMLATRRSLFIVPLPTACIGIAKVDCYLPFPAFPGTESTVEGCKNQAQEETTYVLQESFIDIPEFFPSIEIVLVYQLDCFFRFKPISPSLYHHSPSDSPSTLLDFIHTLRWLPAQVYLSRFNNPLTCFFMYARETFWSNLYRKAILFFASYARCDRVRDCTLRSYILTLSVHSCNRCNLLRLTYASILLLRT